MRTTELIDLLVRDGPVRQTYGHILWSAFAAAVAIAAVGFFAVIGFRHDILSALHSYRFLYKFVVTVSLGVSAGILLFRVGRPGTPLKLPGVGLVAPVVLLLLAVLLELLNTSASTWGTRMVGHNARFCLTIIPLLSFGPLACFIHALRSGAPARPGLAGAVAGLASAGIAATFYAANCDDDSPLFVLLWYPIAITIVTSIGWLAGRRWLRW